MLTKDITPFPSELGPHGCKQDSLLGVIYMLVEIVTQVETIYFFATTANSIWKIWFIQEHYFDNQMQSK